MVTTAGLKIPHILSDQDKRLPPLENLVSGLDRNIFFSGKVIKVD